MLMQSLIQAIYPPHCIACAAPTDMEHGLCGACWPQTKFITGTICDKCGVPLPGDAEGDIVHCDDCMRIARLGTEGGLRWHMPTLGESLCLVSSMGIDWTISPPCRGGW